MPRYEFLCEKCQKPFELTMTISEHEKEKEKVRCPTCKSTRVVPQERVHGPDEEEELMVEGGVPPSPRGTGLKLRKEDSHVAIARF
jgi:putative FmdB family regulatory protein